MSPRRVIAIDGGGTEIKAGLISGSDILDLRRWPTERHLGPDHARDQILLAAKEMYRLHPDAVAVGLVVPGVVDAENGVAIYSENICWENVPFGRLISDLTGLPVAFGHDVRAGGIAESTYGGSVGYSNSFFMPIGTGIAGAITLNHKLFDDIYAGEIGHLDVGSGYPCACGSFGCLESISTGPSIARIYNERRGGKFSGSKEVLELALQGETVANGVWDEAMSALGRAVLAYVNIIAPEIILFGGGVSRAGAALIDPIEKYLEEKITFQRRPLLKIASLGDSAGMIGAGILASRI
jgi:glucokinase